MRTGSSWLCSILNSHPDICCKQEILHYTQYKGKMGSSRSHISEQLINCNQKHVGFKILYHQMRGIDSISYHTLKYYINELYKCKIIHIIRDELEVYISHRRAKKTKLWNIFKNMGSINPIADVQLNNIDQTLREYNEPIMVNVEDFKLYLNRYREWKKIINDEFETLQINYSELPNVGKICDYLEVENLPLLGQSLKLCNKPIEDCIINYEEISRLISGYPV